MFVHFIAIVHIPLYFVISLAYVDHALDLIADNSISNSSSSPLTTDELQDRAVDGKGQRSIQTKKPTITYNGDFEPDELIPAYVNTRVELLQFQRGREVDHMNAQNQELDEQVAYLEAKIRKIKGDPLFDGFLAEQEWKARRIKIEQELAEKRKLVAASNLSDLSVGNTANVANGEEEIGQTSDDISAEAERIAAEVLQDSGDDEGAMAELFASLPQMEINPDTGASQSVINSSDGSKIWLRDFGKWSGVNPRRVLEDFCRSRYNIL